MRQQLELGLATSGVDMRLVLTTLALLLTGCAARHVVVTPPPATLVCDSGWSQAEGPQEIKK